MAALVPGELFVLVSCHDLACAVATRWVGRLLLADEVDAKRSSAACRLGPLAGEIVSIGGRRYAAWDLGTMLGLPPLAEAWVLLNIPYRGKEIPIALRTGPCLTVQPLAAFTALPEGLFRARRSMLAAAFPAGEIKGRTDALFGVCVDPSRAWTSTELERSARSISLGKASPR